MKLKPSGQRGAFVALALSMLGSSAWAQESRGGPRDETREIEERKRWFIESRGLDKVRANPRAERARAVNELRQMRGARERTLSLAGEVWTSMGPSAMNMGSWTMGRVSGRVNAVVPHPTDENTVYFGAAAGGVWKTTNAGASWTPMFDAVGTLPIGAIHVEAAAPNNVWVGTGDKNGGGCAGYFGQGVFLSTDAGTTWSARNGSGASAMPLSIVNAVALQPTNANVVLAGGAGSCTGSSSPTSPGVFRSTDRGATWTRVLNFNVEDIVFAPGSATAYASVPGQGVFKSTDGGATWANSSSGLTPSGSRMRLAMAPSDALVLYVLQGGQVYRSMDGAATWSLRTSSACEGQCTYNQAISVHPTDVNQVLVGTIRPARSADGGTTFTFLTTTWGSGQMVHQDVHVVLYSRTNGSRFWIGSDGGLWRTDNGGTSFANMNSNLNVTQFYDLAVHPNNADTVFGGAQDNSSSRRTTSPVWDLTFVSGDGFMNAVDATNTNYVFQTSYPSSNLPSIYRSTTGGAPNSFSKLPTTGITASSNFPWVTPMVVASNRIFVAGDTVYRGTTSASPMTWAAISANLGARVSVLTPMLTGTTIPMYAGTSSGAIHSTVDAAAASVAWTNVTGNYPGGTVSDVAMTPGNRLRVFVTRAAFGGNKLFRSTTGGTTWTAVGAGLPNVPANSVAIDPLDTNRVFVGTDVGVYESTDGGDTFVAFSAGLPLGLVVTDLEVDDVPHVLVAGTYGRGAWKVNLTGGPANQAPVANFNFTSSGLTATFSDTSTDPDGTIASRTWAFGDGTTSSATGPSKTYAAAGTYAVQLTVTDNGGATGTATQNVTVSTGAGCPGTLYTGTFSGATGQTQIHPGGTYYQSTTGGTHAACLTGPTGTDFDLYLDRWDGTTWVQVAASESASSVESISYPGTAAYYRFRVVNYAGVGAYNLTISRPQ
ncbi:PKD domain-containing protein [Pyxidicoccus xibeiensis]|uniref:PKD domain-containing protein n=1 Tax=Pyxidicoccus xibeiensis TaxID=2906759 RepID=UPI0020A730DB|nr:PKD domain-containing protein [Pyxidicoccus xibeiensis]MCP3141563.1 PKD domain-containing protein [Pyxidicoccus xibeiensis]